jgi:hypothetical protein
MSAPITVAAVVTVAAVIAESVTVETTKCWTDEDAEPNWRNIYDRTRRRWRVIVSRRGCAVRLNHISTGVRAYRRAKPECEHRQCNNETFLSHNQIFLPLFRRFNPTMTRKLPRKISGMFLATDEQRFASLLHARATRAHGANRIMRPDQVRDPCAWRARRVCRTYFLSNTGRYAS